jgi:hypothetical protein
MIVKTIQTNFSSGEIDPALIGRTDTPFYSSSAEKLKNVVVMTQGGVMRRPGLEYCATLAAGHKKMLRFKRNSGESYTIILSDLLLSVYRKGILLASVASPYSAGQVSKVRSAYGGDTILMFHPDISVKKLVRQGSDNDWVLGDYELRNVPSYDFDPTTINGASTTPANVKITPSSMSGNIVLALSAANSAWDASVVGQYFEGAGGRARITRMTDATHFAAAVEVDFFDTSAIEAADWDLLFGFEPVWSDARGWPPSGGFGQGRLWLSGSKTLPYYSFGSKSSQFDNFDLGTGQDSDALMFPILGDSALEIFSIVSSRLMQFVTSDGVFTINQTLNEPITSKNINIRRSSLILCSDAEPAVVESETVLIARSSLWTLVYDSDLDGYKAVPLSLLSDHLVNNPSKIEFRQSSSVDVPSLLVCVNAGGSIAVANILASQELRPFTWIETEGLFMDASVEDEDIYAIVRRAVGGSDVDYLERFADGSNTDCCYMGAPPAPGALAFLEGKDVWVVLDGSLQDRQTVAGGSVEIRREAERVEIGIPYEHVVRDLPVEVQQLGTVVDTKKRVSRITARVADTKFLRINGRYVSFRKFGPSSVSPLDKAPPAYSGIVRMDGFLGWDATAQVELRDDSPFGFRLLSLAKQVNV